MERDSSHISFPIKAMSVLPTLLLIFVRLSSSRDVPAPCIPNRHGSGGGGGGGGKVVHNLSNLHNGGGQDRFVFSHSHFHRQRHSHLCGNAFMTGKDCLVMGVHCTGVRLRAARGRTTTRLERGSRCDRSNSLVFDNGDDVKGRRICGSGSFHFASLSPRPMTVEFRSGDREAAFKCYVRCKLGFKRWRSKVESHRLRGTLRGRGNQERGKRQCLCGVTQGFAGQQRIFGGSAASRSEYPWQVAIVPFNSTRPFCGGAVVSDRWVLTAAHCVQEDKGVRAVMGEHNHLLDWETVEVIDDVKRIIRHPRFNRYTNNYDYALLELEAPVPFSLHRHIRPVCLPSFSPAPGTMATVTGWGLVQKGRQAKALMEVEVPLISRLRCSGPSTAYHPTQISPVMFCAGDVAEGGIDTCKGDSGGPLVVPDRNGNYEIHGVVSWGKGCAEARQPGVYANVSAVMDWIKGTTGLRGDFCPRMPQKKKDG